MIELNVPVRPDAVKPYSVHDRILDIRNLSHSFDGKQILREINAQIWDIQRPGIKQGQVVSIIGQSGRGKTTLAKDIAGLTKPTTGEVLVCNGHERPVRAGEMGYVFQDSLVFEHLTVYDNLLLAAAQGMFADHADESVFKCLKERLHAELFDKKILRDKVDPYLESFGLKDQADKHPGMNRISGGQRQRLAVLMQVLCSSPFIIFDEPNTGQDPVRKQETSDLIIRTANLAELKTLIVITHDLPSAFYVSDTVWPLGFEQDPQTGKFKPGATLFEPIDLAKMGMAWHDASIQRDPIFNELVQYVQFDLMPKM